jgi:hypothetical protein
MNCEKCQELLSEFIDGELKEETSAEIKAHLGLCAECAELHEDFAAILQTCEKKAVSEETVSPNSKALWCRINNIIEAEIQPEIVKVQAEKQAKKGWFARNWSFSVTQITTAIVGIAIISSLLTVIGIKNASAPSETANTNQPPSLFQRVLSKVGLAETPKEAQKRRIQERQDLIDYWNKRVQARRLQWDKHLREAFDRNLQEIDQVVFEYTQILEENPQDEVSSEMLDSALNEKVDLLREFSEL